VLTIKSRALLIPSVKKGRDPSVALENISDDGDVRSSVIESVNTMTDGANPRTRTGVRVHRNRESLAPSSSVNDLEVRDERISNLSPGFP
jgi:hypothetical protein